METGTGSVHLPKLCAGILFTTIGALSVHAVMLQILNVPFPDLSVVRVPALEGSRGVIPRDATNRRAG
jgi:hypothetical protein